MSETGRPRSGGRAERPPAEVAERLVRGEAVPDADPRAVALARLLTAAARPLPGRPQDERAVLDAFQQAVQARAEGATDGAGLPDRGGPRPGRWRSVKALIGAGAAVFALAGAAIAAESGALPGPFPSHAAVSGPSTTGRPPATARHAQGSSARPNPATASTTPHATDGASPRPPSAGRPSQGTAGSTDPKTLCESYFAAQRQGGTVNPAVRARLAREAGGLGHVDAYCAATAGIGPAGRSASAAAPSLPAARPSARGGKPPTPHATGPDSAPGAVRRK